MAYLFTALLFFIITVITSCKPAAQNEKVIQLDTYLIYAGEDGEAATMPILPGELSVHYVNQLLDSTQKIYDNLKKTYGYDVFQLKGDTRNLFRQQTKEQRASAQLDTFMLMLNYKNPAGQPFISVSLHPIFHYKKMLLSTQIGFSENKTIVLGMGQSQGEKRSAVFLVLHPKTRIINNEKDLEELTKIALPDMKHQLQLYQAAKQIRKNLHLNPQIDEDYENIYPYFRVRPKPILKIKTKPDYPEKARKAGTEGTVVVTVAIRENGSVGKVLILKSAGGLLDSAAVAAAKKCKFIPGKRNGKKVKTMMNIPFRFKLSSPASEILAFPEKEYSKKLSLWPRLVKKVKVQIPKGFDLKLLPDMNIVRVTINEKGKVVHAEIMKNARSQALDAVSLKAAKQFMFTPGLIAGKPAKVKMLIPFKYTVK